MLKGITQASKELGVSAEHIRRMVRAGRWPVYRLGPKAIRLDVDEVKRMVRLDPVAPITPSTNKKVHE